MEGLGKWDTSIQTEKCSRLKTRKKMSSRRESLLSEKDETSHLGESAAVHFVQSGLASFSDGTNESDDDLTVENTVEKLTVTGSDVPVFRQEKEARSAGGIPS